MGSARIKNTHFCNPLSGSNPATLRLGERGAFEVDIRSKSDEFFFTRTGPIFSDPMDKQASQTRNDKRANYEWHKTMSQQKCKTDEDDQCDD